MIAIYSNTGEWGGVDVLIARFSEYLRSHKVSFVIIEPSGSRLRLELPWAKFLDHDEVPSVTNLVTHVFVPSVAKLRDELFPWAEFANAKLFTWVVHPNDVFLVFFPFSGKATSVLGYQAVRVLRSVFRAHASCSDAMFRLLVAQQALAVMDGATSRSLRYFVPSLPAAPPIIPIPSHASALSGRCRADNDLLSIGYLGRMDSMKWSAMKSFVHHVLAPLATRRKIVLHVVSEGSHLVRLEEACKRHGIRFIGYGYLPNEKARETIISNTDVNVAMGTSALDIAACGHPCIVLDPALRFFSPTQNKFRFIDESSDYTLGEYRDFPGYQGGLRAFEEAVSEAELDSAAARGKRYVKERHDPTECFDSLLLAIQNSRLLVSELAPGLKQLNDSFARAKSSPLRSSLIRGVRQDHG